VCRSMNERMNEEQRTKANMYDVKKEEKGNEQRRSNGKQPDPFYTWYFFLVSQLHAPLPFQPITLNKRTNTGGRPQGDPTRPFRWT